MCCSSTSSTLLVHESTRGGDSEGGSGEGEGLCSRQSKKHMEKSGNSGEFDALRAVTSVKV